MVRAGATCSTPSGPHRAGAGPAPDPHQGPDRHTWREGEDVLFDDTWGHEVTNHSKGRRSSGPDRGHSPADALPRSPPLNRFVGTDHADGLRQAVREDGLIAVCDVSIIDGDPLAYGGERPGLKSRVGSTGRAAAWIRAEVGVGGVADGQAVRGVLLRSSLATRTFPDSGESPRFAPRPGSDTPSANGTIRARFRIPSGRLSCCVQDTRRQLGRRRPVYEFRGARYGLDTANSGQTPSVCQYAVGKFTAPDEHPPPSFAPPHLRDRNRDEGTVAQGRD